EAARTYTLLTVGDGLVTQVPALIVSTAAGLLVSKAGVSGAADKALLPQLSGYPTALGMSAAVMIIMSLLPGIPMIPFLAVGGGAGMLAFVIPCPATRSARAAAPRRARHGGDVRRRQGGGARRGADQRIAQDRRPQDRARLCSAAAGQ